MERKDQENNEGLGQNDVSQNQNPTLQDPGAASVADYGKSEQNLNEPEEKQRSNSDKSASSIPKNNEDTLGIP